jgi:hypothetical protein
MNFISFFVSLLTSPTVDSAVAGLGSALTRLNKAKTSLEAKHAQAEATIAKAKELQSGVSVDIERAKNVITNLSSLLGL